MSERLNQYRLATNDDFRGIIEAAAMVAAMQIIHEDESTENHEARLLLASTILTGFGAPRDREYYLQRIRWSAAMNPAIQASAITGGEINAENILDNDIDFVVSSLWTSLATSQF